MANSPTTGAWRCRDVDVTLLSPRRLLNSDKKNQQTEFETTPIPYLKRLCLGEFLSNIDRIFKPGCRGGRAGRECLPDNVSCRRTKYQGQDLRRTMARCFMDFSPSNEPGELSVPIANAPKCTEKLGRHRLIKSDLLLP